MPLSGEECVNVERTYNEAAANRIDLSKFNLDSFGLIRLIVKFTRIQKY